MFSFCPPPVTLTSPFFLRFRNQGTVGNPCLRTTCFLSPRSSLVAPPERLSPVRPVSRLDSPQGRVSNDRVPRLPNQSPGQTTFHIFPVGSLHRRSSARSRPRRRLHVNTFTHAARLLSLLSFRVTFLQSTSHIQAIMHSPRVSSQNTHAFGVSGLSFL